MAFAEKHVSAQPVEEVNGWQIKPYHVTLARNTTHTIAPDVVASARELTAKLLPAPDGEMPPIGWTVLHEGGNGAMYLCVYAWTWGNVVEVHTAAAAEPALGTPDDDPTNFAVNERSFAGCVWELPVLTHERTAWVRWMYVPELPDPTGYLADRRPDGPIGLA